MTAAPITHHPGKYKEMPRLYDIQVAPRHFAFTFVSVEEEAGNHPVSQSDRLSAALAHVLPALGHEVVDFAGHWENLAEDWWRLARYMPAAFAKLDPTKSSGWLKGEATLTAPLRGCDLVIADSACFGHPIPERCAGLATAACPLLPPDVL